MSDPLAERRDVTIKGGLAASLTATATLAKARDREPYWTTDTLLLYVYDLASNSMIPVGHNAISGSFTTTDGKTITITNGLVTSIV